MNPHEWERLKSAHARALILPPTERNEFLRSEFPAEPELARRVRDLLQWHDQAGDFLSTPLAGRILGPLAGDLKIQRLGPWALVRELGRGGSATVFLARRIDDLFEKQVAIKVLNRLSHSEEIFRRFQREIQILARMEHPHIVRLLEAGTTGEALSYIVTEFVDGVPIDEFSASLELPDKLRLFLKICEGLAYAHQKRIVHRDIKPSNILVTADGNPKIVDFGIALLLDQDSRLTQTGLERMTIRYASPEQVRGKEEISASSDVYSLGVVLYEMVAGRSPYGCGKHEMAGWILSQEPLPISGTPRDISAIVVKALRKTPDERYGTVESVRDDVQRFLDGRPVSAQGRGAAYRAGKFLRRRWRGAALVAAGALLALAGGIATQLRGRLENRARAISLESPDGHPLGLSFSPDGRSLYYLAGDEFFDFSDLFLKDLAAGRTRRLTSDGVFKIGAAVSPDGRWVGFLRSASESTTAFAIVPTAGGGERRLFTAASRSFAWGADSHSVIVSRSDGGIWPHLRGFDIRTNEWWEITPPPREGRGDGSPALSADGRTLCFVRQESRESADLFLLKVDALLRPQGEPRRLTSRRLRVAFPGWTPDGREIFFASGTLGNYHLFRVASDGRSEPREIPQAGSEISAVAVAMRIRALAVQRDKTEGATWELELGGSGGTVVHRRKLALSSGVDTDVTLSPDGKLISFESERSGEPQIWVANADGTQARQLTSFAAPDLIAAWWLRDGSGLVVHVASRVLGQRNYVIGLASGLERELAGINGNLCGFSRDGRWLYFSQIRKDIDIYKYSMATAEVRQVTHDARGSYAMESPDGRTLYFSKPEAELGLWKIPAAGGVPIQVLPNLARRTLFDVRDEGIYYVERLQHAVAVKLRRFADGTDQELYRAAAIPQWGFSIWPGRRSLLLGFEDLSAPPVLLFGNLH